MTTGEPNLRPESAPRPENGKELALNGVKGFRPRSFSAPPPDPAEALYYEGMAAYQHRNWEQALERFSRLKELQPNRPGLEALLDEVRWFRQLQAAAPAAPVGAASRREPAEEPRPRGELARRWRNWALVGLAVVGIVALTLIALGGRWPWAAASGREAQELYNRGQARLAVGDYEGAQAAFKKLLELTPNDPEAVQGLSRAERQQTLAQDYAAAEAAIAVDDWDTAGVELASTLASSTRAIATPRRRPISWRSAAGWPRSMPTAAGSMTWIAGKTPSPSLPAFRSWTAPTAGIRWTSSSSFAT